ncbi:ATP-binding protein [Acidobacteriota bacterium]
MTTSIFRRFRRNIVILILAISLVPFLSLCGIIFYEFFTINQYRAEEQIKYRARSQASAVDFFLKERTAILRSIADLNSMDGLVQGDNLAQVFSIMNRSTGGFVDLGVIDSNGQHRVYVGPYNLEGLNYYDQPWFAAVMSKGVYISDVYMGYRQIPHFIIAVRRQENQESWILRATIDSDIFNYMVREAKVGTTGDAFIINQEGVYQSTPRFDSQVLAVSGLDTSMFEQGVVIEKSTSRGKKMLHGGHWLKNKNWLLVIKQDPHEGMTGLFKPRYAWIVYISLGCAAIVFTTLVTTRLSVAGLERSSRHQVEIDAVILQNDKMAALGKMAAGIAHEINNPLAVIAEKTGWMEDLLEEEEFKGSESYEEYKKSLEKISHHIDRAKKITLNMLSYARKMEPRLEDVNVNSVIEKTVDFMGNIARINNMRFETRLDPDLPIIAGDESKLQQVFLNIVSNAIDATGDDGIIEIATSRQDGMISVSIKDNGPGIPKNLQKKIFDPFFTTKQVGRGTGLGLWICFNILDKMGGSIQLDSAEGKGAAFTVDLPIVLPEQR